MSKAIIKCKDCGKLIEVNVSSIFRTVSSDTSGDPTTGTIRYSGECKFCKKG